jgi:hypothetical protein
MRSVRTIGFLATLLAASVAAAQTARVFHLTGNETSEQMQQIVTTIRAIAGIRQISMDAGDRTVSVDGTAAQLDLASWLIQRLDPSAPLSGPQVYRPPDPGVDDIVRVVFLAHAPTPQQMQEIATIVRSVADIQRIFINNVVSENTQHAIVMRGTGSAIALAAWLINQLDQSVGVASPAPHQYNISDGDVTQAVSLTYPQTVREMQEIVTLIRSVADVQRIFIYNTRKTIALRGTAEQIALTEWLLNLLDRQAPAMGTNEYRMTSGAENLVRVFYLANSRTPADTQKIAAQVRSAARVQRLFVYSPLSALALRGTVGQVATAEKVIEEMN